MILSQLKKKSHKVKRSGRKRGNTLFRDGIQHCLDKKVTHFLLLTGLRKMRKMKMKKQDHTAVYVGRGSGMSREGKLLTQVLADLLFLLIKVIWYVSLHKVL